MPADTYDLVPYADVVVKLTSPSHVGAVALLLGADPPPPKRILELGCGTGANTIAIAGEWPDAEVIGMDLSARQIQMAQSAAKRLTNITFLQADILASSLEALGPIDYLICHGVYSWVPPSVQARILELCTTLLFPRGVAIISFNVLPGWHQKNALREILRFHTAACDTIPEKLEQGRLYLELIEIGAAYPDSWATQQMRALVQSVQLAPESYLLHEYLCDFNEPLHFTTFAERISHAGLQYIGDADFGSNVPAALSEETKQLLMQIASSRHRYEQHLDFMTNRTFRHALIMRGDAQVTGRFSSQAIKRLRFRINLDQCQSQDPIPTAMRAIHPSWSTMEMIAETAHQDIIGTAGKVLVGIAEGWVEPRMVE